MRHTCNIKIIKIKHLKVKPRREERVWGRTKGDQRKNLGGLAVTIFLGITVYLRLFTINPLLFFSSYEIETEILVFYFPLHFLLFFSLRIGLVGMKSGEMENK